MQGCSELHRLDPIDRGISAAARSAVVRLLDDVLVDCELQAAHVADITGSAATLWSERDDALAHVCVVGHCGFPLEKKPALGGLGSVGGAQYFSA